MRRREVITFVGGLAATSFTAFAQSSSGPARLGYLWIGVPGSDGSTLKGIKQGLADVGLIEGRNITLESRYAEGRPERLAHSQRS
jgi:hypothetical protein